MSSPQGAFTQREVGNVPSFDGVSSLVARILAARGITDTEAFEQFFNETYESGTHDPFLMKDMRKAVDRILRAIKNGEKIAVYGDYDADGIPGSVAFSDFLKEIGAQHSVVYIPHRGVEGFGLNMSAIDEIADAGATLLITIDCGIADVGEVARANEHGIDVIVTDHHTPLDQVPEACAILNPKQDSCTYPYKELCGAGVVYKFIQAIASEQDDYPAGREKWYLDLVGIATLADMVPLTGENRLIARYGLFVLRKSRRPGVRALFKAARTDLNHAVEDDVSFMIAPRINAASRMADPHAAFNMLASSTHEEARGNAHVLEDLNKKRKTLVARIVKDIKKTFTPDEDAPVVVTGNPQWKPGILGLVAGALVDTYGKPAFVWGREPGEEGVLKGSARSNGRIHLVELMKLVPEGVFANFGGHAMSGGFSIDLSSVHDLPDHLAAASEQCDAIESNGVEYDSDLAPADITTNLFDEIDMLAPFGVGNEKPIFRIANAQITNVRFFGKEKNHLEITFRSGAGETRAIGFFMAHMDVVKQIEKGSSLDLYGALEKSHFGGSLERRVRIVAFA